MSVMVSFCAVSSIGRHSGDARPETKFFFLSPGAGASPEMTPLK